MLQLPGTECKARCWGLPLAQDDPMASSEGNTFTDSDSDEKAAKTCKGQPAFSFISEDDETAFSSEAEETAFSSAADETACSSDKNALLGTDRPGPDPDTAADIVQSKNYCATKDDDELTSDGGDCGTAATTSPSSRSTPKKNKKFSQKRRLSPHSRKLKNKRKKTRWTYEKKAEVVYFFDKLTAKQRQGTHRKRNANRRERIQETNIYFGLKKTKQTFIKWFHPKGRQKIEDVLGMSIAEFMERPRNKGGRGKKTPGRFVKRAGVRREAKYKNAEASCIEWIRKQRGKGLIVQAKTLRKYMIRQVRKQHADVPGFDRFKASAGWLKRFMGRHKLTWRRRNDNALKSASHLASGVQKFIKSLRALRAQHPDQKDPIWGIFGPKNTLNIDQIPLPFASSSKCTIEFLGTQRVWLKQPGSGLDKRQATLQLLIRGEGKQPKPVLIFRGKKTYTRKCDKKKRLAEESKYDEDVIVLWQPKSWADTETCVEWAQGPFTEFIKDNLKGDPFLLLCDNLNAQTKDPFLKAVADAGPSSSKIYFGPPGATHLWQPVDRHVGAQYKTLMADYYHEYMAERAESDQDDSKVSPEEQRVLLTQWAGRAYRELEKKRVQSEQAFTENPGDPGQSSLFFRAFLRTGCLVDPAGQYDDHIHVHANLPKGKEFLETQYPDPTADESKQAEAPEGKSDESGPGSDSEDVDDEFPENSSDSEVEPVADELMVVEEEDEKALMRAAHTAIPAEEEQQLLDFRTAAYIARQHGTEAYQLRFAPSEAEGDCAEGGARRTGRYRKSRFRSLSGTC